MSRRLRSMLVARYTAFGALFGLLFPIFASLILVYQNQLPVTLSNLVQAQRSNPLLWIIDTAPLFLGLFAYFIGVRQDRLLHLMENLNRIMLENIPDSVLILDEQQRVIDLNANALQALGLSKLQAERWPVSSVIPGWPRGFGAPRLASIPERWETTINASVREGVERGEWAGKGLKGGESQAHDRVYDVRVSPLYGWQGPGASSATHIVILRDITDLKRRTNELATLLEATRAVSSTLDLESILSRIVEQIAKAFNATDCTISRWDKEADAVVTWVQEWTRESQPGSHVGEAYDLADFPATRAVLQRRQPLQVLLSDPGADQAEVEFMRSSGAQSMLLLPLAVGDRVFGLVELGNTDYERVFSPEELQLAQALADQAAIAIENARLYTQVQANLEQIQTLHSQYLQQTWIDALGSVGALEYAFVRPGVGASAQISATGTEAEDLGRPAPDGAPLRSLEMPIRLRDQVIGALTLEADAQTELAGRQISDAEVGEWTAEEMAVVEAVVNQVALTLENARLLEQTQRTAERERLAASLASRVWASTDIESILRTTLLELGRSLQVSDGLIQIDFQSEQESYY